MPFQNDVALATCPSLRVPFTTCATTAKDLWPCRTKGSACHLLTTLANPLLPLQMELCSWMGAAIVQATLVERMPDAMRKDMEKSIQEAPAGRKQPERFTRKEQARRAAAPAPVPVSRPDEAAATGPAASAAAAPEEEEVCFSVPCAQHLRHSCLHNGRSTA